MRCLRYLAANPTDRAADCDPRGWEADIMQRFLISRHRLWQVVTDAVLVSVALYAAFLWRFDFRIPHDLLHNYQHLLWSVLPYVVLLKLLTFVGFGLYNKWWRYSGIRDLTAIILAAIVGSGVAFVGGALAARYLQPGIYTLKDHINVARRSLPIGVIAFDWVLTMFLVGGARLLARIAWERPWRHQLSRDRKKVLVVGAGDAGELVVREMLKTRLISYQPVGFVDDDPRKKNLQIHGVRVVGTTRHLPKLVEEHAAEEVIIAIPSVQGSVVQDIVSMCKKANVSVKTLPGVYELIKGSVTIEQLREVQVEDILGRGEVSVDLADVADLIKSRTVMVTGAGGSIGSEMCRQIAAMNPRRLLLVDHAEDNLFTIHHELETERHFKVAVPLVADVKNVDKMRLIFEKHRPHVVFHAAAYKHVPMMEANPREAFENNTLATLGLSQLALEYDVERFVFISTDKAVDPGTVMGTSKALGERVVETLAQQQRTTKLMSVRFGNVLGSSGSVVPIFKRQIAAGGPVTITDERMTRYFMTIPEAVRLVLQAAALGRGGEIFVLDMGEPVKIVDLAREMIRLSGLEPDRDIAIEFTGVRPGEKLHERLFNEGEEVGTTAHPKIRTATRQPIPFDILVRDLERIREVLEDNDLEAALQAAQLIVAPASVPSAPWPTA
jgi:FlaA1/EpsC-like NDP-sugar epimerase